MNSSENIRSHFFSEAGIRAINKSLSKHWRSLHKDVIDAEPEFNLISRKFDEIVRSICVVFRPTETGGGSPGFSMIRQTYTPGLRVFQPPIR